MRINHNIAALNASHSLKRNDNSISKNLQKLSSGYRINSAADDAAGLAVSEKMRAQINGLNQAEDNAQNGISLVQTAEGGLNETESILQRMNTLAVESANGTYDNGTDRDNLNKEVTALKTEINRISTSTNFNGISLLDGTVGGYGVTATLASTGFSNIVLSGGKVAVSDAFTITYGGGGVTVGNGVTGVSFESVSGVTSGDTYTLRAIVGTTATVGDAAKWTGAEITFTMGAGPLTGTADDVAVASANSSLTFQIGSDNKDDQSVSLTIGNMGTGANGLNIDGVNIGSQDDAKLAIDSIKAAINKVSATRADLGALQNRLEHTTNNLGTMSENLTSAESTIRDVDMSSEMVELTKNQILEQAATSMLAQANTQPQSVLSLLKG